MKASGRLVVVDIFRREVIRVKCDSFRAMTGRASGDVDNTNSSGTVGVSLVSGFDCLEDNPISALRQTSAMAMLLLGCRYREEL